MTEPPATLSCPSCGGAARVLHRGRQLPAMAPRERYRIARMQYSTPSPILRCDDCQLGWAETAYDGAAILDMYGEGEDPAYALEEGPRRRTFRYGLDWVKRHRDGGKLLDVGASAGFLLAEARELGYEPHGIEPSRWAAGEAKTRYGLELVVGSLDDNRFPDGSFDVITMVDVIEHLTDPFAALSELRRLLGDGGVLYLATPDLGGLPARLLGRRWWGYEPFHLFYFNRRSLSRALGAAGFEVAGTRSYRRTFSLDYWLQKCGGLLPPLSPPVFRLATAIIRRAGLAGRDVSLDLRDTLEVVARVRPAADGTESKR